MRMSSIYDNRNDIKKAEQTGAMNVQRVDAIAQ